jgi:hypothetical protein
MANVRYYAPRALALIHASGRTYPAAAQSVTDLPETEAQELDHGSVGAIKLPRSGASAQRPTAQSPVPVKTGEPFIDTTISKTVYYTGSGATGWIDHTGASA